MDEDKRFFQALWVWIKPCDWINGKRGKWKADERSHDHVMTMHTLYSYCCSLTLPLSGCTLHDHCTCMSKDIKKEGLTGITCTFLWLPSQKIIRNKESQLIEVTDFVWVSYFTIGLHFNFCFYFGSISQIICTKFFNCRNKWMQYLANVISFGNAIVLC